MKKLLTLVAALLVMGASAFAQEQPAPKQHNGQKHEAEKIGFLTQRLDLTPEEAQVFWPVYNQFAKEAKDCHKAVREARKALRPGKDQPAFTEAQYKGAIDKYIKAVEIENALMSKYNPKFLKVLSAEKVAKLYIAEEQYRTLMLRNISQHQGQMKGKKAPMGGPECGQAAGKPAGSPDGKPCPPPAHECDGNCSGNCNGNCD